MNTTDGRAWRGVGLTDQGRVRRSNQDAFAVLNDHALWIVADGMGGRPGGDVASRMAVESLISGLPAPANAFTALSRTERIAVVRRLIEEANHAIREEANRRPELIGMGTTVVVMMIDSDPDPGVTVAHVGDSRAYRLRDGGLMPLTADHSLIEQSVRDGELSAKEALTHPLRHVLTRALGTETKVECDISTFPLRGKDRLLLCTDGLTKMLADTDILRVLLDANPSSEATCRALAKQANRRGGDDNITVILVKNELTKEGGRL